MSVIFYVDIFLFYYQHDFSNSLLVWIMLFFTMENEHEQCFLRFLPRLKTMGLVVQNLAIDFAYFNKYMNDFFTKNINCFLYFVLLKLFLSKWIKVIGKIFFNSSFVFFKGTFSLFENWYMMKFLYLKWCLSKCKRRKSSQLDRNKLVVLF